MLHTLTCPNIGQGASCTAEDRRVIRARNVADAVLGLIETYMSDDVRRRVTVCSCCGGKALKPALDWFAGLRRFRPVQAPSVANRRR